MDTYIKQIKRLKDEFEQSENIGEKMKLANHFFLTFKLVQEARNKFGDETVHSFVEGGRERIKEIGENMPKTKKYLTLGEEKI